ncbi:MAG: hypothetical protein ACOY0R_20020 [Chloroflexota bacterium]
MDKAFILLKSLRGEMRKSRAKIWLRAFLFVQFSLLFSVYFFRDIGHGYFKWEWVALVFAAFTPIGLLLGLIVPMKADVDLGAVTFSLDKFYLFLIWFLVVAKLIIGRVPFFTPEADFIMASIMGIMFGRLGGIGLRVRQLKLRHGFTA